MRNIKNNKKLFLYFLYLPILINFLLNLFNKIINNEINKFNIFDIISTSLLFIFLFLVGQSIKNILQLPFISTGIVTYLISYFIFDNLILLINLFFFDFSELFIFVNIFWLILIILYKEKLLTVIKILLFYLSLNVFNSIYYMKLTKNINIIGDVQDVLLKHVKSIYENSYLYSMYNPTFEGYPQLTAYVQATLHKIMVNNASFEFLKSSANIVLFLVVLLFAELNLSKISKFIIILIYISLVFNSEWLKLIFIDSLMTEGIISYLFATLIFSISNQTKSTNIGNSISFLLLGILFIGKQFISTLSLIAAVSFLFSKSKRKFVWIGFIGVLIKEVSYTTYFKNLFKNYHLKEVDIFDAFIDLILFRNLKIENLFIIAKNLYLDKPFFIIFIYFIGTIIFYLFNYSSKKYELNLISLLSILNIGLVIALYIGIWKNMELESPIRFLLYKLPLYLYFQIKVLEDYILKNKIH